MGNKYPYLFSIYFQPPYNGVLKQSPNVWNNDI